MRAAVVGAGVLAVGAASLAASGVFRRPQRLEPGRETLGTLVFSDTHDASGFDEDLFLGRADPTQPRRVDAATAEEIRVATEQALLGAMSGRDGVFIGMLEHVDEDGSDAH